MGSRIFYSIKTHFEFVQNNDFFYHHMCRLVSLFCSYLFGLFFRIEESKNLDEYEESNSDEEDDNRICSSYSKEQSSSSRYEFLCGKVISRFMEEPETLSFTIHDSLSDSDFCDAIMDTPILDTGEDNHKLGLETEKTEDCADELLEKPEEIDDSEQDVTGLFETEKTEDCVDELLEKPEEIAHIAEMYRVDTGEDKHKLALDTEQAVAALFETEKTKDCAVDDVLLEKPEETEHIAEMYRVDTAENKHKVGLDNSVSDDEIVIAAFSNQEFKTEKTEDCVDDVLLDKPEEETEHIAEMYRVGPDEDNSVSDDEIVIVAFGNQEFKTEKTEDSVCSNEVFQDQIDSNNNLISVPEPEESESEDEYIELLLPNKHNSILFKEEKTCDLKLENDEHEDLIQQLKMELKLARTGGLPTILEESESPLKTVQVHHLKPMKIDDQKLDYKQLLESIRKVHRNYSDKMRKLDILNFQTMHSLGLVEIKGRVELQRARKSLVPTITSLVSHNLWLCKGSAVIEPMKKVIVDMQTHFETVYIGHLCLSWEILHWQYSKAQELQNYESNHSFNQVAGEFQLFQVLLQRFMENEQFQGPRIHNYVNNRCVLLRTLLQVPLLRDDTKRGNESNEDAITSRMLPSIIEQSMKVFWDFVRADKGESNTLIFQSHMQFHSNLEQLVDLELLTDVRIDLQKKEKKLKDILRSGNCIVKRFKKQRDEDYGMHLVAKVELKLVAKVLSMTKLTREKLIWCHEKLDKINVSNRKVFVEPSFLLFPC